VREDFATREEELKAREEQAFQRWVKGAPWRRGRRPGRGQFITKGDVVVIKPNVAFDKNPDLAATTQPDRWPRGQPLPGRGARKVIVADTPINTPRAALQDRSASRYTRGRRADAPQESYSSSST